MAGEAVLGPDEIRALLRECVTVIRPGDILLVRVSPQHCHTPNQLREMAQVLGYVSGDLGISAALVYGDEMATATRIPGDSS